MTKAELSRALDLYKYTTRLSLITAQAFRMLAPNLSIKSVASSRLREGFKAFLTRRPAAWLCPGSSNDALEFAVPLLQLQKFPEL
jgi:hypothetical protein